MLRVAERRPQRDPDDRAAGPATSPEPSACGVTRVDPFPLTRYGLLPVLLDRWKTRQAGNPIRTPGRVRAIIASVPESGRNPTPRIIYASRRSLPHCMSPLMALVAFGYGTNLPSKLVAIGIAADISPPPVPVGCAGYDP
jgi:hypothetical protein